jgi:hypothetical protein
MIYLTVSMALSPKLSKITLLCGFSEKKPVWELRFNINIVTLMTTQNNDDKGNIGEEAMDPSYH